MERRHEPINKYPRIRECPFCGGRAVLEKSHRAFINAQTTRVAFVRCTVCNARSGREKLEDYGCTSTSIDANRKVIQAWNRRYNETNRR